MGWRGRSSTNMRQGFMSGREREWSTMRDEYWMSELSFGFSRASSTSMAFLVVIAPIIFRLCVSSSTVYVIPLFPIFKRNAAEPLRVLIIDVVKERKWTLGISIIANMSLISSQLLIIFFFIRSCTTIKWTTLKQSGDFEWAVLHLWTVATVPVYLQFFIYKIIYK